MYLCNLVIKALAGVESESCALAKCVTCAYNMKTVLFSPCPSACLALSSVVEQLH